MNPAIIQIKEEELGTAVTLGYDAATGSLLATIDNDKFLKKYSFHSNEKTEAIQCCQTFANNSIKTLLVEGKSSVTVWILDKTPHPPAISTSKVKRKYRGQTYEDVVTNNSANQQPITNTQKIRKKYRGQYID